MRHRWLSAARLPRTRASGAKTSSSPSPRASPRDGRGPQAALRLMHVCGTHERASTASASAGFLPRERQGDRRTRLPRLRLPRLGHPRRARDSAKKPGVTSPHSATCWPSRRPPARSRTRGAKAPTCASSTRPPTPSSWRAPSGPSCEVVFFSVGFETTFAPTAAIVASLEDRPQPNFSLVVSNRVVPEALEIICSRCPASRSTASSSRATSRSSSAPTPTCPSRRDRKIPCAVVGFEPVDLLEGILDLLEQIRSGESSGGQLLLARRPPGGNAKAKALIAEGLRALRRGVARHGRPAGHRPRLEARIRAPTTPR